MFKKEFLQQADARKRQQEERDRFASSRATTPSDNGYVSTAALRPEASKEALTNPIGASTISSGINKTSVPGGTNVDRRQRASDRYAEEHQASKTGKTSDYIRELNTYEVKLGALGKQMDEVSAEVRQPDGSLAFKDQASLSRFEKMAKDYEDLWSQYKPTLEGYRNQVWDDSTTAQKAAFIKEALDNGDDPVKIYPKLSKYGKSLPFTKTSTETDIERYLLQKDNEALEKEIPESRKRLDAASREHANSSAEMVVANQELEAARAALDEAARNLDMFPGEESQKAYDAAVKRVEEAQAAFDAPNQKLDSAAADLEQMRYRQYMNKYRLDYLDLRPELAEKVKLVPELEQKDSVFEISTEYRRAEVEQRKAKQELDENPSAENQRAYDEATARLEAARNLRLGDAKAQIEETRDALKKEGYSEESIDRLIEVARQDYNAEQAAAMMKRISEEVDGSTFAKIGLSLASVPMNLVSGIGFLGKAVDIAKNQFSGSYTPVDWNSDSMQAGLGAQTIRSEVAEAIGESWAGGAGSFFYQTGMSMVDSSAVAFLTATTGLPAYHLLGGSAATSAMLEAKERGASDGQALVLGLLSGVAESLFEKVSVERLLAMSRPASLRATVTNALKQGGAEASEEFNTAIANWISDGLIMGDLSSYNLSKQRALDDGATEEEAAKTAALEMLKQVGLDALGGFLSGGVMGGVRSLQLYTQYNGDMEQLGRAIRAERRVADELEKAKLLGVQIPDKLDSAYKNGTALDDKLLGELAVSNEGAAVSLVNSALATQDPLAVAVAGPYIRATDSGSVMGTMTAEDVASLQTALKDFQSSPAGSRAQRAGTNAVAVEKETTQVQSNTVAQTSTRLDSIETAFTDQGMQLKTAQRKAAVVRKLMSGELITQKEANALDISNPSVRDLVSRITGVQLPSKGELTPAALQELFQSTTAVETEGTESVESTATAEFDYREAAKSPEMMDQAKRLYAEITGEVDSNGELPVSYREFETRYRTGENAKATNTQVALAYQQYLDDTQTRPFAGRRLTYNEFRSEMLTAPGADQLTEADIRSLFEQAPKNRDFVDVVQERSRSRTAAVEEAAQKTRAARRDSAVTYLKKALSKTGIKDIVVEYDGVFDPDARVNGGVANAYIQNGVIHLNGNRVTTEEAVYYVLGHELTHRAYDADGAQILTDIIDSFRELDSRGAIAPGALSDRVKNIDQELQSIRERYGEVMENTSGLERPWMAEEELAGDLMSYLFGDPKVMDAILGVRPSLMDHAHSFVQRMIRKLKGGDTEVTQILQRLSDRFAEALNKTARADLESGTPVDVDTEIRYSIEFDQQFMDKAEQQNGGRVSQEVMDQARKDRAEIAEFLSKNREKLSLPPDVMGNTQFGDSSYGLTEENTTVCIRSMAADDLMDAIAEHLGRPLTVEDTIIVSQELFNFTDKPECLYCYVAMDRKANRQYLGRYIQQRDTALKDLESGMPVKQAYEKFLDGRKDTKQMRDRFKMWQNATDLITLSDVASTKNMLEAAARSPEAARQIADAQAYARSAAWPKKRVGFAAYNNHILKWSAGKVNTLNQHYGMRMYSFSDFSPAFILEDMQRVTDAAVKGLKVLAYTKELDFARIFAPTGMSINISVFGYDDGNGGVAQDGMQGADWAETQKLRELYPGVGSVFVATNDNQVNWALDQDWIDVVIPFHMVRTGSEVAKYFGWTNYTQMSSDVKRVQDGWTKGQDASSIYPNEHQNNKEMYLAACEDNHLTPRFEKWVEHPNYMKLVNETRLPEAATNPVQPIFNMDAAYASLEEMQKRGGYYVPIGGTVEEMQGIASEIAEKLPTDARYSLTDTTDSAGKKLSQEQVDFFKDSKVRDDDGHLKVMYHGTAYGGQFTVFDPDKISLLANSSHYGPGFYFTDVQRWAREYTKSKDIMTNRWKKGPGANLFKSYLNITNPLELEAGVRTLTDSQVRQLIESSTYEWAKGHWKWQLLDDRSAPDEAVYDAFVAEARNWDDQRIVQNVVKWFNSGSELLNTMKRVTDYDGIHGRAKAGDLEGDIYVVFSSEQVKNVDNRMPTNDPDIRYSLQDSEGKELSSEQVEFFKDSKARDPQGRLLKLYHGTGADFTVFDMSRAGENFPDRGGDLGAYFTPFQDTARGYATNFSDGGRIEAVYLNLENPLIVEDEGWGSAIAQIDTRSSDLRRWALSGGHDGIIVRSLDYEMDDAGTPDAVYVAFSPEQIKRVDNLTPTNDADIRYSLSDADQNVKTAEKFFGTTNSWIETGYLLRDGQKLDFSGRHDGAPGGARYVDHRDVRDALGLDYGGDDYSGAMVQFMREGNIRIMPETNGINLSVAPTKAQESAIRDYVAWADGEVIVDLDTTDGATVASVEYPTGTSSRRVLQDIRGYFNEGAVPQQPNRRYSISDEKPYAEQLHEALTGGLTLDGAGDVKSAIYVMKEPTALLQELGFGDYPLVMTQKHAIDINAQRWDADGNILSGADHNHQISEEMLASLPELIQSDVAAVFRADPRGERTRGSVILLTTQQDDHGNPVVIALRPNGSNVVYNGEVGPAHVVASVYGRENLGSWLQNQVRHGTILYVNEKKAQAVPVETFGASFASWYAGINPQGFDTILGQRDQTVNRENLGARRYSLTPEFQEWFRENYGGATVTEQRVRRTMDRQDKRLAETKQAADSRVQDLNLAWQMSTTAEQRRQRQALDARRREEVGRARNEKLAAVRAEQEIAKIEKRVALEDQDLAWKIFSKDQVRSTRRAERARAADALNQQKQQSQEQIRQERELSKAEKKALIDDARVYAKRKAAERLRIQEDAYSTEKAQRKDNEKLRRNAAKAALRSTKKVQQIRQQQEAKQGMVDTLRKSPKDRVFAEKLQDAAQKLRTLGRATYRGFVSDIVDLEQFGKRQASDMRVDTLATVYRGANTTVERLYTDGLYDKAGNRIGDAMQDVFLVKEGKKVNEAKQALLQDYMLHRHNVDRMSLESRAMEQLEAFEQQNPWLPEMESKEFAKLVAMTDAETKRLGKEQARSLAQQYAVLLNRVAEARNKPIFADSDGNAVRAETSQEIVSRYEQDNPWLVDKAQGIYDWWDQFMRIWAIGDSLTLEQYEQMREIYPHYVPTYRADKDSIGGVGFVGAKGASVQQAVKKAKGGFSEVLNIEDSFANIAQKIVRQSRLNEVYMNIMDTLMLDEDGTFADFGLFDWESIGATENSPIRELLEMDSAQDVKPSLSEDSDGYKLTAWRNGEQVSAIISEDLFKSIYNLAGTDSKHWFYSGALKAGNKLTSPMKTAITGVNPNFALRNISRDLPTAIINSVSGLAFPKYWAQAALDMAAAGAISNSTMRSMLSAVSVDISKLQGSADRWTQFQALGGTHSGYYNNESGFAKAMSTGPSVGSRVVEKIGTFNEATESMTRFAEYLATIDRMGDTYENRLQGIKNAAEVTVDFGRHGSVGKVVNAWIPYWNPAVQGINKMWRSIASTDQPGGFSLKRALGTVGRAATTTVVLEAVLQAVIRSLGRDDEWEQFSDRTKDTYYLIPLKGEHQWLKVPKNREWGAILGTPFMRMLEYANGRENPFENYVETSLVPNFLPGGITDMIGLQQYIDLATNEDFAGRDIVPYSLAQGSRGEQWDEDTSYYSIWIANAWNSVAGDKLSEAIGSDLTASPMHLDFILSSYFGDFADIVQKAASVGIWKGEDPIESIGEAALSSVTTPWIANELRSSQVVTDYFDLLDRLDKEVQDAATQDSRNGTDLKQKSTAYQARQAIKKLYGDRISELYKVINNTENASEQTTAREEIAALAQQAMGYYDDIVAGRVENPILDAEYADLPADVSAELIRLDGMTEDYSFTPSSNPSKTYSVPGQKYHQYQIETDKQKDQFDALYMENYGQMMSAALQTSEYQAASDTGKAEILEETRDQVLEATKEQFFSWLDQNGATVERKPLPIDLPTEVAEEIYRLDDYTSDYSFAPSPSPSAKYTDPRRKDKEYVLDDAMKEEFTRIYTEVYAELAEEIMRKSKYRSANDAKKAAMLEEMRSEVLEETKDRFFDWLRDSGIESVKKEKD